MKILYTAAFIMLLATTVSASEIYSSKSRIIDSFAADQKNRVKSKLFGWTKDIKVIEVFDIQSIDKETGIEDELAGISGYAAKKGFQRFKVISPLDKTNASVEDILNNTASIVLRIWTTKKEGTVFYNLKFEISPPLGSSDAIPWDCETLGMSPENKIKQSIAADIDTIIAKMHRDIL